MLKERSSVFTAVKSFTGIVTRPKLMDPDQIACAIGGLFYPKAHAGVYPGCDQSRRALPVAASSRCFFQFFAPHRSPSRSRRLGTVRIVYFANSSAGAPAVRRRPNASTSDQCSGVETGAPVRALTEYGATIVLPRPTCT